jgi:hypothetical protein
MDTVFRRRPIETWIRSFCKSNTQLASAGIVSREFSPRFISVFPSYPEVYRKSFVSASKDHTPLCVLNPMFSMPQVIGIRLVSTKQRRKWKVRKYHFKLRLKRTMRKMRVPYVSSKARGQAKKKPILYDFRPYLRRKLKRAER